MATSSKPCISMNAIGEADEPLPRRSFERQQRDVRDLVGDVAEVVPRTDDLIGPGVDGWLVVIPLIFQALQACLSISGFGLRKRPR